MLASLVLLKGLLGIFYFQLFDELSAQQRKTSTYALSNSFPIPIDTSSQVHKFTEIQFPNKFNSKFLQLWKN